MPYCVTFGCKLLLVLDGISISIRDQTVNSLDDWSLMACVNVLVGVQENWVGSRCRRSAVLHMASEMTSELGLFLLGCASGER